MSKKKKASLTGNSIWQLLVSNFSKIQHASVHCLVQIYVQNWCCAGMQISSDFPENISHSVASTCNTATFFFFLFKLKFISWGLYQLNNKYISAHLSKGVAKFSWYNLVERTCTSPFSCSTWAVSSYRFQHYVEQIYIVYSSFWYLKCILPSCLLVILLSLHFTYNDIIIDSTKFHTVDSLATSPPTPNIFFRRFRHSTTEDSQQKTS